MSGINLAPLLDTLVSLAAAIVAACVPIVTVKLTGWLGVKLDTEHQFALNAALENALGVALKFGQQAGDSALSNVTLKNASVAAAVAYVNANAGKAVSYFGLSEEQIAEKIAARLAVLLHTTGTAPPDNPALAQQTAALLERAAATRGVPVEF